MARIRRLTGGRAWAARLSGLFVLAAIVALVVAVLPVQAGAGDKTSGENVFPYEINLGGQPGDCDATIGTALDDGGNPPASYPGLRSPAANSFRIVNLSAGVPVGGGWFRHTDSAGAGMVIEVNPAQGGKLFDFRVVSGGVIADVIVNGGSNSTHFVYSRGVGHVATDFGLHAPNKGRGSLTNYFSTSHAEFCYDIFATISGKVWHDNDQDGIQDNGVPTTEPVEGLLATPAWTINLYPDNGPAQTTPATGGTYSFPNLPLGDTYTICEVAPAGQWAQSNLSGAVECTTGGEEPQGHVITLQADVTDADFGNFMTVTAGCGSPSLNLGGNTITFPPAGDLCTKSTEEYVFEAYLRANGEQVVDFRAIDGSTTGFAHVVEVLEFTLPTNQQNSTTLNYNDGDPNLPADDRVALYCNHDPRPLTLASVANLLPGAVGFHTTCIIESVENADGTRSDTLYTLADARRWM